jgi:hypothetical protein
MLFACCRSVFYPLHQERCLVSRAGVCCLLSAILLLSLIYAACCLLPGV